MFETMRELFKERTMNTRTLNVPITDARADHPAIVEAASAIVSGGLVAFPTETVYGLGADTFSDEAAVKRDFLRPKVAPADNPLIVHVSPLARSAGRLRSVRRPVGRQADAPFLAGAAYDRAARPRPRGHFPPR